MRQPTLEVEQVPGVDADEIHIALCDLGGEAFLRRQAASRVGCLWSYACLYTPFMPYSTVVLAPMTEIMKVELALKGNARVSLVTAE